MEEMEVSTTERRGLKAEETWTGPTFTPTVDIYETEEALTLIADMPGVAKDAVNIDLEKDRLTISGQTAPAVPEGETVIRAEYQGGRYLRRFALSGVIDQSGIKATSLSDGVLMITLPKVRHAQPRKIKVETTQ
jgi:HSP20 family protein